MPATAEPSALQLLALAAEALASGDAAGADALFALAADPGQLAGADDFDAFSWQPATSRTGNPKAVGTGPDAGQVLYGDDAVAALDAGRNDTAAGQQELGSLRRRADAGDATAAKQLIDHGNATVGRWAGPPVDPELNKALNAVADAAAGGDADAAEHIREQGYEVVKRYSAELAKFPPADRDAARAEWLKATKGLDPDHARAVADHLLTLAADRSPDAGMRFTNGIGSFLKSLTVGAAGAVCRAIGSFAKSAAHALGPFGWWAGGLLVAGAIAAAPVAAVAAGLIPAYAGFVAAVPSVLAGVLAGQRVKRLATRSAGRELYGMTPANGFSEERVTAGQIADIMIHRFGWRPTPPEAAS